MRSTEQLEVLALGETMILLTPDPPSPLRDARDLAVRIGGAESNVAMHLARLGHSVAWASRLGDDPLGTRVRAEVEAAGVDCRGVVAAAGERTGVYFKDPGAHGTTVHYYRAGSAAAAMDPPFVESLVDRHPDLVHVSGITSALSASCASVIELIVGQRVFGSAIVSFDVNFRPALWDVATAGPTLLALAQRADVVFVGLDEAATLWGCRTAEDVRSLIPEPVVVVKDGGTEAIEFDGATVTREPALPVDIVESVGAGDAFAAGWLSARARGDGAARRLRTGHLIAAHVLAVAGDQADLPNLEQREAMLGGADSR